MSSTINFEHGALISGRKGRYSGVLDAFIDESKASHKNSVQIEIIIRVFFRDAWNNSKVNIDNKGKSKWTDTNGVTHWVELAPWPKGKLHNWSKRFVSNTKKFWDGKLWLKTPKAYKKFNLQTKGYVYRPNVWCRFTLESVQSRNLAHYDIDVAYIKDKDDFFRSHSVLYDSNDKQKTWRHEVGHLIGLAHPSAGNNSAHAYDDVPGYPDDAMGRGTKINTLHAKPWQAACAWLTGTKRSQWIPANSFQKPKRLRKA
ncbi:hypothetical protein AB1L42_18970 [Thalassoglobus sp. JC818]|uniref:hypothetical protein n=1 Tax=Thalassoglobus sp. JC818 TaxID=3232136 RepID=UPI00345777D5